MNDNHKRPAGEIIQFNSATLGQLSKSMSNLVGQVPGQKKL